LEHLLNGYDPQLKNLLIEGLTFGFQIPYMGPQITTVSKNHFSSQQLETVVSDKIRTELSLDRISGPFHKHPFKYFHVSPLGVVPKKDPGQFRLIHDLSHGGQLSVNHHIAKEDTSVIYETLDIVIEHILICGKGALISKADIENAFRILPIHPNSYNLLGFQWKDMFYYDRCLPMGCSISCRVFESFSNSLQWILQHKLHVEHMSHILDDFIFIGPPADNQCRINLLSFFSLAERLGIPIKHSKTVFPTTVAVVHGIELDTVKMIALLPQDKLDKMRQQLSVLIHRKKATLREIQSIVGLLNFACKVITPGRPFLRRLINLTVGVQNPHHHIRITAEARADILAWLDFLMAHNGVSMLVKYSWVSSDKINLYTDAAASDGYAAILGSHWVQGQWLGDWKKLNITALELFPIVAAVITWPLTLQNHCVVFNCDNISIVHVINAQTSKEPAVMFLLRKLVLCCMTHNIMFKAHHIVGTHNIIADKLSRSQVFQARLMAPWLDREPTPLPMVINPDVILLKKSWLRRSHPHLESATDKP
jgi:hypothetical protein